MLLLLSVLIQVLDVVDPEKEAQEQATDGVKDHELNAELYESSMTICRWFSFHFFNEIVIGSGLYECFFVPCCACDIFLWLLLIGLFRHCMM